MPDPSRELSTRDCIAIQLMNLSEHPMLAQLGLGALMVA
jgi:hypothetical protein